jgi:hypothetical protein
VARGKNSKTKYERRFRNDAIHYLNWARKGDWSVLAAYIARGGHISPEIRTFLVEVLRGKKRFNNRSPTQENYLESVDRATLALLAMEDGLAREAAIDDVAERTRVDRRTIQRDLKKHERLLRQLEEKDI